MSFHSSSYPGLVSQGIEAQQRFFPQYSGDRLDFDFIIIGSGMGGGILADELADQVGHEKRILVIEAGSYLFPTHVYNVSRIPNASVASHFKTKTFYQLGDGAPESRSHYIHEELQLALGGRSIFWSGLIPEIQDWELHYFPDQVRSDLANTFLSQAGSKMNESRSLGEVAKGIVQKLRQSPLASDFEIVETPRALHQPYLNASGTPTGSYFTEPTGVFNTAELLINQLGLPNAHRNHNGPGLHLLLNHYVEDILPNPNNDYRLVVKDVLGNRHRDFYAPKVILAAGSLGSPKLLKRSTIGRTLTPQVQDLIGIGLTDHPTTDWVGAHVTHIGNQAIPRDSHAKIALYSKGKRDGANQIKYPFNIEVNVNHEYWHLRENDPSAPSQTIYNQGESILEIKFSFANCLDSGNGLKAAAPFQYVPELYFQNLHWTDHLAYSRFPTLAGWQKSPQDIFNLLNQVASQFFSLFKRNGAAVSPYQQYGQSQVDFGLGTVHHAVGTLRMPHRPSLDANIDHNSVVDEQLRIRGTSNLYVCDMSTLPISTAANPVRTLAALALRLGQTIK